MIFDEMPRILNSGQHYALDCMSAMDHTIFLTGKAGTGKSTVLQLLKKNTEINAVFLAPTGVAAVQIMGQTIHSFFKLPPKIINFDDVPKLPKKFAEQIQLIIIDEISMVRADVFDYINISLQISRKNNKPFGGVRIVCIGDLYQLPPVVQSEFEKKYFTEFYDSPYFFSSKVFPLIEDFEFIELYQVLRQKDASFIQLLNKVRNADIHEDELYDLNMRYNPFDQLEEGTITLTATNIAAQQINLKQLQALDSEEYVYLANKEGKVNPNNFPVDEVIRLKIGAQVIILKNDSNRKYVNGTIGIVTSCEKDRVLVSIKSQEEAEEVWIERNEWSVHEYMLDSENPKRIKTQVVGYFKQIPLRMAWAITIHKSQGKTFDKVCIDLGRGAFEHGQTYVALSRCTRLDGIFLRQKLRLNDIRVDERIVDFYQKYQ